MSANKEPSTSQNVPDASSSFSGGQILPPAQIRPLEESNMMNFHNTVKKTMTFTIGGNLTENRQNTQLINQNINRISPNKPIQNNNTNQVAPKKVSIPPSTPKPVPNPQTTPRSTVPQQIIQPSKNTPIAQPVQQPQANTTTSTPLQRQQTPKQSVPPVQTNVKPSANPNPAPSQPKPPQTTSTVPQRPQNVPNAYPMNSNPSPNSSNNNNTMLHQQSMQNRPVQQVPPMQQQVQRSAPKPVQQPPMNLHIQQNSHQQPTFQQRPPTNLPQQQPTYYPVPGPKVATTPHSNVLKRPLPPREYEGLYRERQALYQLQLHTLHQRQHYNFMKQQSDQSIEDINKQIAEIERQYLQQQQKLIELDARLVQQMQQEPGTTIRNPNLALQHTRLQAAIEDIRKEAPKVTAQIPKPRGRPIIPFPAGTSTSSAPVKKIKKVSSDGEDATEPKLKPTRFNYYGNTPNYELSWLMLGSQLAKDVLTQHKTAFPDITPEAIYHAAVDAERQKKAKKLKPNPPAQQIKLQGNNTAVQPAPPPTKNIPPPPVGTIFIEEKNM